MPATPARFVEFTAWPVTLTLVGLSVGVVFYMRRRGLGVVLVVLFLLVAVAAWQFECDM
ncbi:hypothetical protein CFY86_20720 [Raoultella ornithinolytica]|uniref:Uncharacterized protein n=1 Tax=Raoultella ornithinolytica TaxID=54291 RepID=A0A855EZK3_RAOOR|nr:hypothetical protein CFY86_20720 [Raoultella ornithinolytica]